LANQQEDFQEPILQLANQMMHASPHLVDDMCIQFETSLDIVLPALKNESQIKLRNRNFR